MTLADVIAEYLVRIGIRHVFGVGGANIEDVFAAVQRRRPDIRAVLSKHEHAAATAADAYARIGGGLGVVMATSGGGAMNLVHGIAEARASRVPLLAIVGEPPTDMQGRGAFQDTSGQGGAIDAAAVFRAVGKWCARVSDPADLPRLLAQAVTIARAGSPGPAVLLVAKDTQRAEMHVDDVPQVTIPHERARLPDAEALARAKRMVGSRRPVILAGDEVVRAGARAALARLADALGASVAVAPDARDAFDNRDAKFLGVVGAMGHPAVAAAIARADVCVIAGTRLPLLARQGLEPLLATKVLVSFGSERPFVTSDESVHVTGDLSMCLEALASIGAVARSPKTAPLAEALSDGAALPSAAVVSAVARAVPNDAIVLVDAGNTGATAIHHLTAPRAGRWLVAMGMAGMGYTFGAAVGAALASGRRCFVLAGDGAFFMNGLDVHTAVEHDLPITYVIFNNSAHGMCLVRERLLLGENGGYNAFRRSHIGAGLGAMFPGLVSRDCRTLEEVEHALADSAARPGPSVIAVELTDVEVPPFAAFRQVAGPDVVKVERGTADEND